MDSQMKDEDKYTPNQEMGEMCGRCYEFVDVLFPANCSEKPESLIGQPIGQYHCPDCGAMVIAGCPHPSLCKVCINRTHPAFDRM